MHQERFRSSALTSLPFSSPSARQPPRPLFGQWLTANHGREGGAEHMQQYYNGYISKFVSK